jgi:hypothetical protein
MFGGLRQSWMLLRASWAVVRADKEILTFPLLGAAGVVLVGLVFAIPLALTDLPAALQRGDESAQIRATLVLFAFTFCQNVVVLFAQSAVVAAALIRLRGGDPTVGDGLRAAAARLGPILGFAAIAATVGTILQIADLLLRQRRDEASSSGNVGGVIAALIASLIVALIGAAWSVATFFVVPVMIVERIGPIAAIRRSVAVIRQIWGPSAIVNLGMGLIFFFVYLAVVVVGGGLTVAIWQARLGPAALAMLAVTIVAVFLVALVQSALRGVFVAALYRYAVEGAESSTYFESGLLERAFA